LKKTKKEAEHPPIEVYLKDDKVILEFPIEFMFEADKEMMAVLKYVVKTTKEIVVKDRVN